MKKRICCAVLIALAAIAFAQQTMSLSPDEAVDLAIKNNLSLQSALIDTQAKQRSSKYSWNQFIPSLTATGALSRANEKTTSTGFVPVPITPPVLYGVYPYEVEIPQWSATGQFSVEWGINAAMFESIRTLRLQYENGALSYDQAKAETEKTVRQTYYEIVYLREQIGILHDSLANIERQASMAQANYRAGLIPEVDWLRARVAVENFKPNLNTAENGLKTLTANFALILGLPIDTEFELESAPEDIDYLVLDAVDLSNRAAAGNRDVQSLRNQILLAQSGKKAKFYANYTPSFFARWSYARTLMDPFEAEWGNGDNWLKQPAGSLSFGISVKLDSLLPFSSGAQGVKEVDDQIAAAQTQLTLLSQKTAIDIYSSVFSLEKIRTTAEAQEQTVALAERSYRLTEEAYRAGLKLLLDVQSAEQSLRQARLDMLRQNIDYIKGLMDLEYAIGVPFGTLSGRK
jgi:outer membrane protein TolC